MSSCQCQGIEEEFSRERAASNVKRYHDKGPSKTTKILMNALKKNGRAHGALLDIGGGIGAIQYDLLRSGAQSAVSVDATTAYMKAARQEAKRQKLDNKISFRHGDFVELAHTIEPADIVTLDRVICCYDDMRSLVELSSQRARRLYGVVYPRDIWWVKLFVLIPGMMLALKRSPFRIFVHPTAAVEQILHNRGFRKRFHRHQGIWQIAVFARQPAGT